MFFSLQFDILIPKQAQEELTRQNGIVPNVLKQIRINIKNTFHGPVALIQVQSNDTDDGSDAVILVREYLQNHFNDKNVYFECIGPSPFHCDFSIEASSSSNKVEISNFDENGFLCTLNPKKGYDHIAFLYPKEVFESDQEAINALFQHLDDELGLFYQMYKYRSQTIDSWHDINILYKELIAATINSSLILRLKKLINFDGNVTHKLLHQVTIFEIMLMEQSSELKSSYESIYLKGIPVYIQSVIDKKFDIDFSKYPTKEIIYYLEFHEKRYLQKWQTSLLASSALLGAIIGSVITALTSGK